MGAAAYSAAGSVSGGFSSLGGLKVFAGCDLSGGCWAASSYGEESIIHRKAEENKCPVVLRVKFWQIKQLIANN